MNYARVAQGVENAKVFLLPMTQVDCCSKQSANKIISWHGRKSGVFKNVYYPIEYQSLIDAQQYSILLSDGSFFQFYYQFSQSDVLEKARLSFYPSPVPTVDSKESIADAAEGALEREDENLFEHLHNWIDYLEIYDMSPSNTSHIRFDYDPSVDTHSPSHIQFGCIQELRVSADFYPMPMSFIQICLGMLPGFNALAESELAFETNNMLRLKRPNDLMVLTT